jgi:excinuclease ABC subunit A
MGPEGGAAGGEVIATGTPEDVARIAASYTGQFVRPLLERARRSNGSGGGRTRRDRRADEATAP